jgi:hypothetical protein
MTWKISFILNCHWRRSALFVNWFLPGENCPATLPRLRTKDYQLTPEEAYWLGVVDEVTGSGLQSDREMIEMILSTGSATRKP